MKFEIDSNKLEQVIFKYLDNKNFIIKETSTNYYFMENETDEYSKIVFNKISTNCYVVYNLLEELELFFSLDRPDVLNFLKNYVEKVLDIVVWEVIWRVRPNDWMFKVVD